MKLTLSDKALLREIAARGHITQAGAVRVLALGLSTGVLSFSRLIRRGLVKDTGRRREHHRLYALTQAGRELAATVEKGTQ
jgi:hypothetical protein